MSETSAIFYKTIDDHGVAQNGKITEEIEDIM